MPPVICPGEFFAARRIAGAGGLALALLGPPAPAADGSRELTEHDYLAELPVVLSVSRLAQPQADAPASVTVIDREMIRASGARDLSEVLRLVPGTFVVRPPQSAPEVVYHGLTGTYSPRMQVLIDGRTQYGAFYFGGVNWNLIPLALDDIDRIEVVRGSNSAAFGSNAFLGVVSIQTRRGSATPGVTVEARRGQGDIRDDMVRVAGSRDNHEFRLTAVTTRDDGVDFSDDGRRQRFIDARVDSRLGPRDELGLRFAVIDSSLHLGFPGREANPPRTLDEAQEFVQLDWHHVIDESADLALRYFKTRDHGREDPIVIDTTKLKKLGIPGYYFNSRVPVSNRADTERDDFELQHTLAPRAGLRAVWGFGWRSDRVEAPDFFGLQASVAKRLLRLFGNLEWQAAEIWRFNLGATHERDSIVGTMTAPRASANLRLADWASARASVSRAYRSPSLFETLGDQIFVSTDGVVREHQLVGRRDLRPEAMLARELGLFIGAPGVPASLDVRAFDEHVSDAIEQGFTTAVGKPYCGANLGQVFLAGTGLCNVVGLISNIQNVHIRGLEYGLDYRPLPTTRLLLNQAYIRVLPTAIAGVQTGLPANALLNALPAIQSQALVDLAAQTGASAPTHSTTLALIQKLPGNFDVAAVASWSGAMKWANNTEAKAYYRLDWRLGYKFRAGPTRGELAFTVQADGGNRAEYDAAIPNSKRGFTTVRLDY